MKLYASVTSERATKGQGGEYLDISISGQHETEIMSLKIGLVNGNPTLTEIWFGDMSAGMLESFICMDGLPHRYDEKGECTGENCYITKGEKKKSEKHICGKDYCTV